MALIKKAGTQKGIDTSGTAADQGDTNLFEPSGIGARRMAPKATPGGGLPSISILIHPLCWGLH